MGQSSSSVSVPDGVYVPVYKRPKWPNQDWHVSMDVRSADDVIGREVGYSKTELDHVTKKLKKESESGQVEPYIRQRLQDLILNLKMKHNLNVQAQKPSAKDRLQRTFSHLRSFRGSRSPNHRSSSASGKPAMRPKSQDCSPKSPLLEKDPAQRATVHEFDLRTVSNPVPVEETSPHVACGKTLGDVVNRMRVTQIQGVTKRTCDDVSRTTEDTQWFLRRTYKAFKDVEIISAGSIADGTKIISVNEFDFVILLPSMEQSVKEINVLEDTENEYIRLRLVYDRQDVDNGDQFRDCVSGESGEHLINTVLDTLRSFLRPGWTFVSTESKSFVTRIHLTHETATETEEIQFDISLALPISCNKVKPLTVDNPEEIIKLPLWNHLVSTLQKHDGKVFALIPGVASGTTRRISLALAEKEQLFRFGETGGAIDCMCFCKTLVALFFPLVLVSDSWEPYIPPYLLKNAVFFLMDHYNDAEKWQGQETHSRVVEVFLLLGKSLWPEDFGSRGSRISLFVFPGFTSFPEYCNDSCRFDPVEQRIKDSMSHSFQEEQASFPCKFLLQNELDSLLEVPDFSQVFGKYADRLKNTDWKFRELLVDLIAILKDVFDYSGNGPWAVDVANNNAYA